MATTNFIDQQTVIPATWLNDVDAHVYNQDSDPHPQYAADTALTTAISNNAASTGSSLIGHTQGGTGASTTTVQAKLREWVSVKDFGATGNGVTDDTAALTAARDYINGLGVPTMLVFPAGTYLYSTSPNWAISGLTMRAVGKVILSHTGSGNACIFDAGASANVYGVRMEGDFHINGNANSTNGVYNRAVHHSFFEFRVTNCATTGAGLKTEFAVANMYHMIRVSSNEAAFTSKPNYGMKLSRRNPGESTAYCTFIEPIIEGVPVGIYLEYADGNLFLGGTAEGCTTRGVDEQSTCTGNHFTKMDFEVNTTDDMLIAGRGTVIDQCDSNLLIHLVAGAYAEIRGGFHQGITIDSGVTGTLLEHFEFNRLATTGAITDNGTNTIIRSCRNATGASTTDKNPYPLQLTAQSATSAPLKLFNGTLKSSPAAAEFESDGNKLYFTFITTRRRVNVSDAGTALAGQAVGGSPYVFQNTTDFDMDILLSGGTVSVVELSRDGTNYSSFGTIAGQFTLSPGDRIRITYTVAPTMVKVAR